MLRCHGVPDINKYANVHECWQVNKLAKYFGIFLVNFCIAKVKEATNILTSAEQYRRNTGVLSIMPKIPEISFGIQMERSVSVSSDQNIPDHLWRWSTYFGQNIPTEIRVPFLTNRFFALVRIFGIGIKSGKSHFYWLARFNREMSFHFPRVFPQISDWSVWHNGKHPRKQNISDKSGLLVSYCLF